MSSVFHCRLAMAINNAQMGVFGTTQHVIGLFIWRQNSNGVWEMSMTPEMRKAIGIGSMGAFATIPRAE